MIASTRCFLTLYLAASASMLFASGSALCASNMARFTASDKCALRKYSGSAPRPVRSYMNRIPESAGRTGGGGGPCSFVCAASGGLSGDSASVDNHMRVTAGAPGTLKAQRAPWRSMVELPRRRSCWRALPVDETVRVSQCSCHQPSH